jgi:methionyl-tRNA formyltransferase
MRIALLTYEAFAGAEAVRRFTADHADRLVLVGLSDVRRASEGDDLAQVRRHLRRSGWRIVPYLLANFTLPALSPPWMRRRAARTLEGRPLAVLCAELGLPVVFVDDVNGEAFRQRLVESGAELIVTFHFDQILSAQTIAAVPLGGVNVHAGLLPRHRGPAPTIHALLEDPPALGVTIHRLVPAIDAGPILAQQTLDLPGASAVEAARRLHLAAGPMLSRVLADLDEGRIDERMAGLEPYRGWPTAGELRRLARLDRPLARLGDMVRALRVPT